MCAKFKINVKNKLWIIFFSISNISISGSSATIFAYLGELYNNKQRSRVIMGSAAIYSLFYIMVPVIAWAVINKDWQFQVPLIAITYKPWRLFLILCSLPEIIVALIMLFLPESPKFVLGQGKKDEAYQILQKIHRWNNGKQSMESFEIYEESEAIENRQRILDCQQSKFSLMKSVWIQTAPLFKPPHLWSTILICSIQLVLCATANGFFMFFGQILNKMATSLDSFVDKRMPMCDIINMKPVNLNATLAINEFGDEVSFIVIKALNQPVKFISILFNICHTFFCRFASISLSWKHFNMVFSWKLCALWVKLWSLY